MISRALLRIRSPITNWLKGFRGLSSSAVFNPANANGNCNESKGCESAVQLDARKYARPSTVTWSKRLHNSVTFIGTVEYPLHPLKSNNGSFGVYTSLRVKTSSHSHSSFWITFQMWDELAERAMLHLKPNDYIYISGELRSYTKAISDGIESLRYKVIARELNYVELDGAGKNFQGVPSSGKGSGEQLGQSSLEKYRNRLQLWQIFFANPGEWYDNRKSKKNPKHPDFKHKTTGEVLWLNATDPPWVKKHVDLLDSRLSGEPKNVVTSTYSLSRWLFDED